MTSRLRIAKKVVTKKVVIRKKVVSLQIEMDSITTQKISEYFATQPVLKAWLFGSYARGEEREDSDVDILVELDYARPVGLEFVQMQLDLQSLLKKPIDLVSSRGVSKYIKPYIDADKVLLYEC